MYKRYCDEWRLVSATYKLTEGNTHEDRSTVHNINNGKYELVNLVRLIPDCFSDV